MFKKRKNKKERKELFKEVQSKRIKRQRWIDYASEMIALILAIVSVGLSFFSLKLNCCWKIGILAFLLIVFFFWAFFRAKRIAFENQSENRYQYYFWSAEISKLLLTSLKRTHFAKTTAILQSTYGHMPEWHPISICENVLVYDVHEYLRRICIGLKEIIVNLAPDEFNDDMVTVDIAFEYPSDSMLCPKGSMIPCDIERVQEDRRFLENKKQKDEDDSKPRWKIITSGDHTSNRVFIHNYLNDYGSFYSHIAGQGYVFGNDKGPRPYNGVN